MDALLGKPSIAALGLLRGIQNENKTRQNLNVEIIENNELQDMKIKY